jgi:hypothetical protein
MILRATWPTCGVLLFLSLACGGADVPSSPEAAPADQPTEAPDQPVADVPVEPADVAPLDPPDGRTPVRRVAENLRASNAALSTDCARHAPPGTGSIGALLRHYEADYGLLPVDCQPCAGHGGAPFEGYEVHVCGETPSARGVCNVALPSDGTTAPYLTWHIDNHFTPLAKTCTFGIAEIQEGLDDEDLADLEATSRPLLPGAPVEGIRYWAPPGELEGFLASRKAPRPTRTVEVDTVKGLLRALADDTLILLAPGRYTFLDADPLDNVPHEDWTALSPHYVDGAIRGVDNLVIAAATTEPTVLIQPHGYASVLHLQEVDHVGLFGLTLGHRPDLGGCMGDVVRVVHASNVEIGHSTLFGSGTKGIAAVDVDGLRLTDSVITDSTEGFSDFARSRVRLERVLVAGNTADLLRGFTIHGSEVVFDHVEMKDNHPLVHSADTTKDYGRLLSVGGFEPGAQIATAPYRLQRREGTTLELIDTTVDGRTITWPPGGAAR